MLPKPGDQPRDHLGGGLPKQFVRRPAGSVEVALGGASSRVMYGITLGQKWGLETITGCWLLLKRNFPFSRLLRS